MRTRTAALVFVTVLSSYGVGAGQTCPSPIYAPSGFATLPQNSSVNVIMDTTGNGVSASGLSVTPSTSNAAPKFTLGSGSNSYASDYLSGMVQWNTYSTTDGMGVSFNSGSGNIPWVVSTTWPTATVTYTDTSGHSHIVTINDSTLPGSTIAATTSLKDYTASGTALSTAAAFVTLINTNSSYTANGVSYPGWDPTASSSFVPALKEIGGHESGHGLGLGDRSDTGDIMSQWNWSTSNPGGATNNKSGNAASLATSCDANEVKNNPNLNPPAPPPTCTVGGTSCQQNYCIPPPCSGSTQWNPEYCQCYGYTSPIIIDTDGSGFHLTSASNGVSFDFFGTGTPMQIAWTSALSTNGWLALDRDGDGIIDSAKELFGNITDQPASNNPNGFAALAVFDDPAEAGNGDGIVDANDAIWPALRVWIDTNHDGISQPNELFTLEQAGVSAIDLNYTESRRADQFGNVFRFKGRLVPVVPNGVRRVIYDVVLTNVDSAGKLNAAPKVSPWVTLNSGILPDEISQTWSKQRSK